jgi:hypothetical protein
MLDAGEGNKPIARYERDALDAVKRAALKEDRPRRGSALITRDDRRMANA